MGMATIRLLGGSYHGKRMEFRDDLPWIYLVKKPKKKQWSPMLAPIDPDTIFVIDQEKYEKKYIKDIKATITPGGWLVETKVAFVKAGSKVKRETFWKLAMPCETRIEYSYGESFFTNA